MFDKNRIITHRGLEPTQSNFFSESSFEAFEDQLRRGFGGIEFDPNLTKDGIIVMHDANLSRPTDGKDTRNVADLTTKEITQIPLTNGHIPTFEQVMSLIQNSKSSINSLHLKARLQTPQALKKIMDVLSNYTDVFQKLLIFDVKKDTALLFKENFPSLRLAPSVAHPYDIQRYTSSIGNTLITIDEALRWHKEGLIDGIWGDEWDTIDDNSGTKQFYTKENFEKLHASGLFIAIVTPELHGTSPGLYGGESHADAKSKERLFGRIKTIIEIGVDFICTDYPEQVARL